MDNSWALGCPWDGLEQSGPRAPLASSWQGSKPQPAGVGVVKVGVGCVGGGGGVGVWDKAWDRRLGGTTALSVRPDQDRC